MTVIKDRRDGSYMRPIGPNTPEEHAQAEIERAEHRAPGTERSTKHFPAMGADGIVDSVVNRSGEPSSYTMPTPRRGNAFACKHCGTSVLEHDGKSWHPFEAMPEDHTPGVSPYVEDGNCRSAKELHDMGIRRPSMRERDVQDDNPWRH